MLVVVLHFRQKALFEAAVHLLGCDPSRKTFDLEFPSNLDLSFLPSLIRGLHDGDGSWSICCSQKKSIRCAVRFKLVSANPRFLKAIQSCINRYALNTTEEKGTLKHHVGNCYHLSYYRYSDVHAIGRWMYNVDNLHGAFMEQKYERFQLFERLFIKQKMSNRDRTVEALKFRANEMDVQKDTLNRLILMSKGQLSRPQHWRFTSSFIDKFSV